MKTFVFLITSAIRLGLIVSLKILADVFAPDQVEKLIDHFVAATPWAKFVGMASLLGIFLISELVGWVIIAFVKNIARILIGLIILTGIGICIIPFNITGLAEQVNSYLPALPEVPTGGLRSSVVTPDVDVLSTILTTGHTYVLAGVLTIIFTLVVVSGWYLSKRWGRTPE